MTFELEVRVGTRSDGQPNFLGPFAQGPPADRFVYINSGTLAGQAESEWTRRAKVPLMRDGWRLADDGKHGGGRANAKGQGQRGKDGERRTPCERSAGDEERVHIVLDGTGVQRMGCEV